MTDETKSTSWYVWALPLLSARRRFLMRTTGAGMVLSILAAIALPKSYESTVAFMPPDPQAKAVAAMMSAPILGVPVSSASSGLAGLMNSRSPNATFLAILQSRTVQDDLINRFDLRRVYSSKLYETARKQLAKHTALREDPKTNVLQVTVTAKTPQLAHDLAAEYAYELQRLVVQTDTSYAHQERIFLEGRLKDIKLSLDNASTLLSTFSSRNATMDMENQAKVTLDAAAKLQGELIAEESQLQGLEAIYTPDNVRVKQMQADVTSLRQRLKDLDGSGEDKTSDAGERDQSDTEVRDQPYPSLRQLPLLGAKYTDLYRNVKIEEVIFEALSKQYEAAKLDEAGEIPAVKVLDPPDYPERKSFPPRTLIILLGTVLALLCGVAWIVGSYIWEKTENDHPVKTIIKGIRFGAM